MYCKKKKRSDIVYRTSVVFLFRKIGRSDGQVGENVYCRRYGEPEDWAALL